MWQGYIIILPQIDWRFLVAAGRNVDFTQKEMEEMIGLDRTRFKRNLEKVCEMYKFDINNFKKEKDNPNSHFTFPPEIAELLALLVRNYDIHPKTLANKEKGYKIVKASDVAAYNKKMLSDIDEMEEIFKKAIYCRPGHYSAANIAFWSDEFIKQLTWFIMNLSSLKGESLGDTLAMFTKKMDVMNYNLYKGESIRNLAMASNEESTPLYLRMSELDKKMNRQNQSIDVIIADMIQAFLPVVRQIREENFRDYAPPYEFINANPILGIRVVEVPEGEEVEEDKELLRMLYYRTEVACLIDTSPFAQNEYNLEHLYKKNLEWKSILEGINDGSFKEPYELSNSEKIKNLKENIQCYEADLRQCRELLKELEHEESDTKEDFLTKNIKKGYQQHCKHLGKNCSRLNETVDRLVGQAMEEIMK